MVAFVAIISIASCKKEIDWNAEPDPIVGVEVPVTKDPCELTSFELYDAGSLEQNWVVFHNNSGLITTVAEGFYANNYTYSSDNIVITGSDNKQFDITLENGRAIKIAALRGNYETYTYNSQGYISVIKLYSNSTLEKTTNLTYENGNLVRIEKSTVSSGTLEVTTLEYSSELSNSNIRIIKPWYQLVSDFFLPGNFYGKTSKNLITKATYIRTYNSNNFAFKETDVKNYTYTKDDKGNYNTVSIVKTNIATANGMNISNETYNLKYILYYYCN